MQLNGAEIVIECLKEQGVDTIFGYPGGAILNVYDELYKHRDEIRHILTSHEFRSLRSHAMWAYLFWEKTVFRKLISQALRCRSQNTVLS